MPTKGIINDKCDKYGLCRDKVDPRFREPFILRGYRKSNMKAFDCLKSIFVYYCNETINVWSHFLAFLYFAVKFWNYFSVEFSLTDPFLWPLLCYAIGIMIFCLMSSIAHTFNSVSPITRNICFSLDYAAISIYSVGAGQAFYFYSRPVNPSLRILQSPLCFLVVSTVISIGSTIQCCLTRQKRWHTLKYLLRTLSYVTPALMNSSPFIYRMLSGDNIDSCKDTAQGFVLHGLCYFLGGMANISRLPERYVPGLFDIIGKSHHLMHIFTAVGANIQYETVKLDMLNRKSFLSNEEVQLESWKAFWYMSIAIIINFSIALWFGLKTPAQRYDEKEIKKEKDN